MSANDNFPFLSSAQIERLALLSEELGEAQQAVGKVLRHGYGSYHPDGGLSNKQSLEVELGHVYVAIELLVRSKDLDVAPIQYSSGLKLKTVKHWMHHQNADESDA